MLLGLFTVDITLNVRNCFYVGGGRRRVVLEKDKNGALGISIAGGLGSPIGDRPVIIAYAQGQAAAKVEVRRPTALYGIYNL